MKRCTRLLVAAAAAGLILAALPASAGNADWRATPGGWVSGPVEHVRTLTGEAGTAIDAVVHDGHLYVTAWRSFSIYDVRDPLDPRLLSTTPLVVGLINEEPQTNGDILLISRDARYLPLLPPGAEDLVPLAYELRERVGGGVLDIYDVRDKTEPALLATFVSTAQDHLWTCVLDCAYAYSAGGTILDLRVPSQPTVVGNWSVQAPYRPQRFHHVAEVAPGIVMTGSLPIYVLDARKDPASPTVLVTLEPMTTTPVTGLNPEGLPARVDWPHATHNRLALVSMETPFTGPCTDDSGDFQTYVTTGWQGSGTFRLADRYQIATNGTFADGRPPANAAGCSAYGMDAHPRFGTTGGAVAVTFFEHGIRILDVDVQGRIAEAGGFLPHAGNSAAVRWLADDVVYVIDLHRGIDVLRVAR